MESENIEVKHHKKESFELTVPMAVIISGFLISGSILIGFSWISPKTAKNGDSVKAPVMATKEINTTNEPFVGNPNAPVTVAYWFDYQCPFCKRAEGTILSPLLKEYVATGKVKVVFKGMEFLGPDSISAGVAEYAVWEVAPNKFLAWHQAMFDKQDTENGGWGNASDINTLTKQILGDADAAKVANLIATKGDQYKKMIQATSTEAGTFEVGGTPTFMVNNETVKNLSAYSDMQNAINASLK